MNTKFKRLIEKLKKPNGLILAIVYAVTIIVCACAIMLAINWQDNSVPSSVILREKLSAKLPE